MRALRLLVVVLLAGCGTETIELLGQENVTDASVAADAAPIDAGTPDASVAPR